ncbi:MAG TPA: hypothetical protein VF545_12465, partial [Thermoleophilaceae bacterium]
MAGGGLLLGSLWMPWYGASVSGHGVTVSDTVTAWEALALMDYGLAAASGVVLLGGLALCTSAAAKPDTYNSIVRAMRSAGALTVCFVLYRIVSPFSVSSMHDVMGTGIDIEVTHEVGMYAGL